MLWIDWMYVAYSGLAQELNRHALPLHVQPANVRLAQTSYWCLIASAIPLLGLLPALANLVLFPMVLHDLITCGTRILTARERLKAAHGTRELAASF